MSFIFNGCKNKTIVLYKAFLHYIFVSIFCWTILNIVYYENYKISFVDNSIYYYNTYKKKHHFWSFKHLKNIQFFLLLLIKQILLIYYNCFSQSKYAIFFECKQNCLFPTLNVLNLKHYLLLPSKINVYVYFKEQNKFFYLPLLFVTVYLFPPAHNSHPIFFVYFYLFFLYITVTPNPYPRSVRFLFLFFLTFFLLSLLPL